MAVPDDGCGGADATGDGLAGLTERLHEVGGSLHVRSSVGAGTELTALVPLAVVASTP